jgi:hypothetical protein
MKTFVSILSALVFCVAAGCAKKGQVDTVKLEASFSTAEPSKKSEVDKVVASVKSQDWAGASASLQRLAADAKLTEEQKKAVKDTLDQIGNAMKEAVGKAGAEVNKALGDAQKSLPK